MTFEKRREFILKMLQKGATDEEVLAAVDIKIKAYTKIKKDLERFNLDEKIRIERKERRYYSRFLNRMTNTKHNNLDLEEIKKFYRNKTTSITEKYCIDYKFENLSKSEQLIYISL